jgi:hypothetical protein
MKIISENRIVRSAMDFACINVFSNTIGADVTRAFRHLFLPPAVLAQKQLSDLHQIVVGLSEKDLYPPPLITVEISGDKASRPINLVHTFSSSKPGNSFPSDIVLFVRVCITVSLCFNPLIGFNG